MGMIQRLRDAYPDVTIIAFDGHYARLGDEQSDILDHITVHQGERSARCSAVEDGRRTQPQPKAVERRLHTLIDRFANAA